MGLVVAGRGPADWLPHTHFPVSLALFCAAQPPKYLGQRLLALDLISACGEPVARRGGCWYRLSELPSFFLV